MCEREKERECEREGKRDRESQDQMTPKYQT
jgi:hypothetical protein